MCCVNDEGVTLPESIKLQGPQLQFHIKSPNTGVIIESDVTQRVA